MSSVVVVGGQRQVRGQEGRLRDNLSSSHVWVASFEEEEEGLQNRQARPRRGHTQCERRGADFITGCGGRL